MRTILLLSLLLAAQAPQTGWIEVNARDSVSGRPIPGADVTLIFYQTPPPNLMTQSIADENGRITFPNAAYGRYSVSARRDGYFDERPQPVLNSVFAIDSASPKRTVDLTLTRGASISGRVVDSRGMPLGPATVCILRK